MSRAADLADAAGRLDDMGARLSLETSAARLVGRLSRAAGRGGGTTLPGKLLWSVDRDAVDVLARRLPLGSAVVSATNGKTTTTAMAAHVLGTRHRLAWNHSGANLASGVASTLVSARSPELGVLEIDEFALPELVERLAPRSLVLCNLFRDQLDRYGELEHVAERWRDAVARLDASTTLIVNADDPLVGSLADERPGAIRYGLDDPRHAREALQHAADSKYCVRCGRPYAYAAAYVGHLGEYACPGCGHVRPALDVVARAIELHGPDGAAFDLDTNAGTTSFEIRLPGLYNVYNAVAAAVLCGSLGVDAADVATGLRDFSGAFGRFERFVAGDRTVLMLLIKNPAGANEAIRVLDDGTPPPVLIVALNDAIADGRDVSWIWDVDFEPLLERAETIVVSGDRAAELALRFVYAGYPRGRLIVETDLEHALDRGLELTATGGELGILPTYTAMLALRAIAARRGLVRPYWEAA